MISWVWIPIAFVIGEAAGFICAAICSGNCEKESETEWARKNGLLYAEDEKNRQRGNADGSK